MNSGPPFSAQITHLNGSVSLRVTGELDLASSPRLRTTRRRPGRRAICPSDHRPYRSGFRRPCRAPSVGRHPPRRGESRGRLPARGCQRVPAAHHPGSRVRRPGSSVRGDASAAGPLILAHHRPAMMFLGPPAGRTVRLRRRSHCSSPLDHRSDSGWFQPVACSAPPPGRRGGVAPPPGAARGAPVDPGGPPGPWMDGIALRPARGRGRHATLLPCRSGRFLPPAPARDTI